MKETVLITGANSFIAQHLIPLLEKDYEVKLLTRNPRKENEYAWDTEKLSIDESALNNIDYIVHLAGSKLNDGTPFTEERKQKVYDSRIGAANFLRTKLQQRNQKLKAFVSASAIGYYGFENDRLEIDETGLKGYGFAADLSDDWEKAADLFKTENVANHVSKIRVSLVLGNESGVFPIYKSILQKHPEVVNQINNGAMPWNHVEDMAAIFAFALKNQLDGVYNSVAPQAASQQDIYKALANAQSKKELYPIKPFEGQHLVAHKIQNEGFNFKYPSIQLAMNNLLDA